ncbi:hypothetical protein OIE99_00620 [Streptomyces cellulosae]|nr:hypothetical protein OIE99_00620 [Streptomyces cellulosae]
MTAWRALDLLEVAPGATVAVFGAASSPLRGRITRCPEGFGFADAVLGLRPDGVDGLLDIAQFSGAADGAVRDGAAIATLRPAGARCPGPSGHRLPSGLRPRPGGGVRRDCCRVGTPRRRPGQLLRVSTA